MFGFFFVVFFLFFFFVGAIQLFCLFLFVDPAIQQSYVLLETNKQTKRKRSNANDVKPKSNAEMSC